MSLYLNVPDKEIDDAIALGARWDAKAGKLYYDGSRGDYVKFAKWILGDRGEAFIACDYVHIIEETRECHKCGGQTKVISLGIGEYIHIFNNGEGAGIESAKDNRYPGGGIHLAWTECENEIPADPSPFCLDGEELIERISGWNIKSISIDDDLQLNWSIAFSSEDDAFLKYGNCQELLKYAILDP